MLAVSVGEPLRSGASIVAESLAAHDNHREPKSPFVSFRTRFLRHPSSIDERGTKGALGLGHPANFTSWRRL